MTRSARAKQPPPLADADRAAEQFRTIAELRGDIAFIIDCRSGQPTWRYLFTRRRPQQQDGPHHGEEVGHVFGNLAIGRDNNAAFDRVDEDLSRTMMAAWVAFARDGNPNGPLSAGWPNYAADEDPHIEFGNDIRRGAAWRAQQLDFLDGFYDAP